MASVDVGNRREHRQLFARADRGKTHRDHARWIEGPRTHRAARRDGRRRGVLHHRRHRGSRPRRPGSNGVRVRFERAPSSWIKMKRPRHGPAGNCPRPRWENRIVAKTTGGRASRVLSWHPVERDRSKASPRSPRADQPLNRALDSTRLIGFRGATKPDAEPMKRTKDRGQTHRSSTKQRFDPLKSFRARSDRGSQAENEYRRRSRETSNEATSRATTRRRRRRFEPFPANALPPPLRDHARAPTPPLLATRV